MHEKNVACGTRRRGRRSRKAVGGDDGQKGQGHWGWEEGNSGEKKQGPSFLPTGVGVAVEAAVDEDLVAVQEEQIIDDPCGVERHRLRATTARTV